MPGDLITITKGEQTRQAILDAAEDLFLNNGYNGTSMRQIAQAAGGIAVGGIYNHFGSKEAIFQALLEARSPYPQFIEVINSLEGSTGPELLRNAFMRLQDIIIHNSRFFGLVIIDIREFEGSTMRAMLGTVMPTALQFGMRVQAAGGMREDLSTFVLMRYFGMVVLGYVITHLVAFSHGKNLLPGVPPDAASADEEFWVQATFHAFLNGVAQSQGGDQ